ncbi:PDZ domain-containing protein [Marinicella sp. S1101]|uniref:S41 family peptidase n=1 Tax=Marinicella marina TaxID=2996016 RepID=UPI002260A32F|nr:S41 family peptidase [Marinicella marina]MCX7554523.1 PDZ domain-containing protein [Marinicella marina]MDJ1140674.1 PDZ domain-containing protein [Marinicella marina]
MSFSYFRPLVMVLFSSALITTSVTATRLMTQPAISEKHIAFIYANDLWVANRDGSQPRRLTVNPGQESYPVFSPDGSMLAFEGQYDGNDDVFVVAVTGGVPKRLTWHPYADAVVDFTPDGSAVLIGSRRFSHTNRFSQLHTVPVNGGPVKTLPIPTAFYASYNDDGSQLAYTPNRSAFRQWKNYRGGTQSRIWLYDQETHEVEEIAKPATGANDSSPKWSGDVVYFRSDRHGEFNLFEFNTLTKSIKQLTDFDDFPVMELDVYADTVIFEQAGLLHTLNSKTGAIETLKIDIKTDLPELRTRYISGKEYVRSAAISPSGTRVVVDFRGEVVTVPVDKGDPNNLTNSPGAHENQPQWSPDGRYVAYFSNTTGEYQLHVHDLKQQSINAIELDGAGFYAHIKWSPDSKKVSFVDNGRSLYVTDVTTKKTEKVASDYLYIPGVYRNLVGDWSPDSNWLSYTLISENNFENAFVYSLQQKRSYPLSNGLSNLTEPKFDPNGQYLYMLASTDAGPLQNWFDQSTLDMNSTNLIYLVTLQDEVESPFKRQNDQQEIIQKDEKNADKKDSDDEDKNTKSVEIDFKGLNQRIVDVPLKASEYSNLRVGESGVLYYLKPNNEGEPSIHKYDISAQKEEVLLAADAFELAADNNHVLYLSKGAWGTIDLSKDPKKGTPLNVDAVTVQSVPKMEWQNIFDEAWQVNRDYFYDPGMHGADWSAMKSKYQPFLADLTSKNDLYRVMQWMFSELAVGHHRFNSMGDSFHQSKSIKGGLLGADYEQVNGRYRIKTIYGGLNWNPGLRSPLTEPGVQVSEGDYILAVNGQEVTAADNLFRFFENTAEQVVSLKVADNAKGKNSRTVTVTPVDSEYALRNRAWVEGNIEKVDAATNGQVAYVYVPNTAQAGHEYFKRYFYPQVHKKAIIVDERYNGGGFLADYVIDLLEPKVDAYWNFRYGNDLKAPSASIQGPKVMLADENAGSGGDYLPYLFRRNNLGTIVGKTTWGGLVGVLGYPQFIDGGSVSAPNVAFYNEQGFGIENEGVAPDIEVEQWPKAVISGGDPQLDKAIEIIQQQLEDYTPKVIERPAYPDRHGLFRDN